MVLEKQKSSVNEQQTDGIVTQIKDGYSSDDISISIKDSSALSDIPQQRETKTDIEVSEVGTETDEEQLHVTVGVYNMLQLYMIGVEIIILSVGVSSLTVMRLKPREILSEMSLRKRRTFKMAILETKEIFYAYKNGKPILSNVNAAFEAGKMYAILGPSGSGKTRCTTIIRTAWTNSRGSKAQCDEAIRWAATACGNRPRIGF